jgi:hypothetical protein
MRILLTCLMIIPAICFARSHEHHIKNKFYCENHWYIEFDNYQVLHDPDCYCLQKGGHAWDEKPHIID